MLPGHEQHHTQGFLCGTGDAFGVPDPFVTVARLTAEPQDAYSAARRIFVELAHQPLGNINCARNFACHAAAAFRRMQAGRDEIEPTSIHVLPT
jgi:hypothetical protein